MPLSADAGKPAPSKDKAEPAKSPSPDKDKQEDKSKPDKKEPPEPQDRPRSASGCARGRLRRELCQRWLGPDRCATEG